MKKIELDVDPYQATHYIHCSRSEDCSLQAGQLYPIVDQWCIEDRHRAIVVDNEYIDVEELLQYYIGFFVNVLED